MTYAIYARYSSDLQRQCSIEDQIRKCSDYGQQLSWATNEQLIFKDEAISGTSTDRPGLQKLLKAAFSNPRPFDAILVDDTSRIARNIGEAFQLFERLKFAGIRVVAVAQGIDSVSEQADVLMTVHGLVDSLYVKELAKKTHRGLEGAVLRGFHAGGRCFGYRNVRTQDGPARLEVDESEAEIVRRIFAMSAAGSSYKGIAKALNKDNVPPPRPRRDSMHPNWAPTAVREMLHRELYIGKVVWNRSKFIKVPGKNKRVARPRPKSEWIVSERPDLRIISDLLWTSVQKRLARMMDIYGGPKKGLLTRSASGSYLFSGLLKCGICGANLTIVTGRRRRHSMYGCPQHFNRGTCSNNVRVRQSLIESQLLSALQAAVTQPETVAYIAAELQRQLVAEEIKDGKENVVLRKRLEDELGHLSAAVAETGHSPSLLSAIAEREKSLASLNARSSPAPRTAYSAQDLVGFAIARLRDLPGLLAADVQRARAELTQHIVSIEMVPVGSGRSGYYRCEGNWNLLGSPDWPGHVGMVAGVGFEPTTFGL